MSPGTDVPPVSRRALNEYYSRSNAPEYNDPYYGHFRIYKRRLLQSFMVEALADPALAGVRPLKVLDLGCGDASDLDFILCEHCDRRAHPERLADFDILLLEGYAPFLDLARRRFEDLARSGKPLRVRTELTDITRPLGVPDRSVHVVLCSEVVEHLVDPEALLAEVFRVLVPGGFLLFTTDNEPTAFGRVKRALARLAGTHRPGERERFLATGETEVHGTVVLDGREVPIHGHINTRTIVEWERALGAAGFVIHRLGTYESVVRHFGRPSPPRLLIFALANHLVWCLPRRLGRHFGATTALMLRRPA